MVAFKCQMHQTEKTNARLQKDIGVGWGDTTKKYEINLFKRRYYEYMMTALRHYSAPFEKVDFLSWLVNILNNILYISDFGKVPKVKLISPALVF